MNHDLKRTEAIAPEDADAMVRYPWPGNVRELRNVIERSMIRATGPTLHVEVPRESQQANRVNMTMEAVEREHITRVLGSVGWRIRGRHGAAEILGLNPGTLYSRMKKLGICRPGRA